MKIKHSFAAQFVVEEEPMGNNTIFECIKVAVQAERRLIELLDKSLKDDLDDVRSDLDLPKSARPRRGEDLRGS